MKNLNIHHSSFPTVIWLVFLLISLDLKKYYLFWPLIYHWDILRYSRGSREVTSLVLRIHFCPIDRHGFLLVVTEYACTSWWFSGCFVQKAMWGEKAPRVLSPDTLRIIRASVTLSATHCWWWHCDNVTKAPLPRPGRRRVSAHNPSTYCSSTQFLILFSNK